MLEHIHSFLSNYWIGLLVLGPISGVLWGALLNQGKNSMNHSSQNIGRDDNRQHATVQGHGNTLNQTSHSNNRTQINHYNRNFYGSKGNTNGKNGNEVLGIGFITAIAVGWAYAKVGYTAVQIGFIMSCVVGFGLMAYVSWSFMTGRLHTQHLPKSMSILVIAILNSAAFGFLITYFKADVAALAAQHSNVFQFFFKLSHDDKILIIFQAFSFVFLALSQVFILFLTYKIKRPMKRKDSLAFMLILPAIFGATPLWLSNPSWSVHLFIENIPK